MPLQSSPVSGINDHTILEKGRNGEYNEKILNMDDYDCAGVYLRRM